MKFSVILMICFFTGPMIASILPSQDGSCYSDSDCSNDQFCKMVNSENPGIGRCSSNSEIGKSENYSITAAVVGTAVACGSIIAGKSVDNVDKEAVYGCHKGYCWAYCGVDNTGGSWCYTSTKPRSQSYDYVTCSSKSDCSGRWKCAGPCTVFSGWKFF